MVDKIPLKGGVYEVKAMQINKILIFESQVGYVLSNLAISKIDNGD